VSVAGAVLLVVVSARTARRVDGQRERVTADLATLNDELAVRVRDAVLEAEAGHERLQFLLDGTPVGIFVTAPDGSRRYVNRRWAELAKMAREGQLQVWMLGNFAVTADAMMLALYGPNAGQTNLARFRNADFDALYRESKHTRSDADRMRIYERMARVVGTWNPWGLRVWAIRTSLARPWVLGYRRNPHFLQAWRFLDLDVAAQKAFVPR
jgi:PAS domain-containing protein